MASSMFSMTNINMANAALFSAINENKLGAIQFACKHHPDIVNTARDFAGRSPLTYAVSMGRAEAVAVLLVLGADINLEDSNKQSPLSVAQRQNNQEIINLILEAPPVLANLTPPTMGK